MVHPSFSTSSRRATKFQWKDSNDAPSPKNDVSPFTMHKSGRRGRMLTKRKLSVQQTLTLVIFAIFSFSVVSNIVRNNIYQQNLQRNLQIKRRLCASKQRKLQAAEQEEGSNDKNKKGDEYKNGGSKFTDLIDRVLVGTSVEDATDEDCETIYPAEVAVMSGSDYYVEPETESSGLTYSDEIPAPVVDAELQGTMEEIDPVILDPDANDPSAVTSVDTNLLDIFEPKEYNPVNETTRPEGTTAYTVVISSCPDEYNPPSSEVTDPGNDIFEASAMLKQFVCNVTETTVSERRRQRRLRGLQENNDTSEDESIANYTMYALVHPQAVNCPNPDGTTYNRVELLQKLGYHVEIVGQPITNVDLAEKQPYIDEHIEEDVGVRDSMALHAFNLEEHNAVVIMDYSTQLQHSIQNEIDELVHNPNTQVKYVEDKDGGVSKGFMIIKPSRQVFETYRYDYLNTQFSETAGWGGRGLCTCAGYLGLKGYFAYRAQIDPMWVRLDRCTYNNQLDNHCVSSMDASSSVVVRHSPTVCGEPRSCPYSLSNWSTEKKTACSTIQNNYMRARFELEQRYLIKERVQEPFGRYRYDTFRGYCDGPGSSNYMGITKQIRLKPSWQTLCPPTICGPGSYMKPDCTCTFPSEDPCNACPTGTRCQRYPVLMCVDCGCGFCDLGGSSCCSGEYSGGYNICHDHISGDNNFKECDAENNHFLGSFGPNTCQASGLLDQSVPNGCGCKPSATLPCEYNKDLQGVYDDKCYICTIQDILQAGKCEECVHCLNECDSCINDFYRYFVLDGYKKHSSINPVDSYRWCLGRMTNQCRQSCNDKCKKI